MIFPRDDKRLMGLYESTSVGDFPGFGIMIKFADFQTFGCPRVSSVKVYLQGVSSLSVRQV